MVINEKSLKEIGLTLYGSNTYEVEKNETNILVCTYSSRTKRSIITLMDEKEKKGIYIMKNNNGVIAGSFDFNKMEYDDIIQFYINLYNEKIQPSIEVEFIDDEEIINKAEDFFKTFNIDILDFIQNKEEYFNKILNVIIGNIQEGIRILYNLNEEQNKKISIIINNNRDKIKDMVSRVDLNQVIDANNEVVKMLQPEIEKIASMPQPQAPIQQPSTPNQPVNMDPNQPVDMGVLMNNVVNGLNSFFTQQQPQPVFQMQDSIATYIRKNLLTAIEKGVNKKIRDRFKNQINMYAEQAINHIYNDFMSITNLNPALMSIDQLTDQMKAGLTTFADKVVSDINVYAEAKKSATDNESIFDFIIRNSTQSNIPNDNNQPSQAV